MSEPDVATLHMHRMLALVGRALEGQHVSKEYGGTAPEDVQGLLDQAFALHKRLSKLEYENRRLYIEIKKAKEAREKYLDQPYYVTHSRESYGILRDLLDAVRDLPLED